MEFTSFDLFFDVKDTDNFNREFPDIPIFILKLEFRTEKAAFLG